MKSDTLFSRIKKFFTQLFPNQDENLFREIPLSVNGKLFVSPMPFGAYDRGNRLLNIYKRYKIDHVFVLVTDEELSKKARKNLLDQYSGSGFAYSRFVIKDFMVPSVKIIHEMTAQAKLLLASKRVVIHCHAGVGRTAVAACCIAIFIEGWTAQKAIENICEAMPVNITSEQRRFIHKYADSLEMNTHQDTN